MSGQAITSHRTRTDADTADDPAPTTASGATADVGGPPPNVRRRAVIAAAAITVPVAAFVVALAAFRAPIEPSARIRKTPDTSVHGTIAYIAADDECLRWATISMTPSISRSCEHPPDQSWEDAVGPAPHLRWGPDGLVITRGDQVTDAALAEERAKRPTTNSSGDRLRVTGSDRRGYRLEITGDSDGVVHIDLPTPPKDGHAPTAFWSPDGRRVVVDDGRLLVLRPDRRTPITQIAPHVRGEPDGYRAKGAVVLAYAVSAEDMFAPPSERGDAGTETGGTQRSNATGGATDTVPAAR